MLALVYHAVCALVYVSLTMTDFSLFFLLASVASTPTGVTVNRTGLTSAKVSWTAPSPAPAGYEVFYQEETNKSLGNTSNTELILTEMTLGVTYSIFVVAYGAEGAPVLPSAHSNTVTISFVVSTIGEGSREHITTGLTPLTSYSIQVATVNDGGTGPYSTTPLPIETLQDG